MDYRPGLQESIDQPTRISCIVNICEFCSVATANDFDCLSFVNKNCTFPNQKTNGKAHDAKKSRHPKNPDPSNMAILRTRTPAI